MEQRLLHPAFSEEGDSVSRARPEPAVRTGTHPHWQEHQHSRFRVMFRIGGHLGAAAQGPGVGRESARRAGSSRTEGRRGPTRPRSKQSGKPLPMCPRGVNGS
jgi:hypothetical protein